MIDLASLLGIGVGQAGTDPVEVPTVAPGTFGAMLAGMLPDSSLAVLGKEQQPERDTADNGYPQQAATLSRMLGGGVVTGAQTSEPGQEEPEPAADQSAHSQARDRSPKVDTLPSGTVTGVPLHQNLLLPQPDQAPKPDGEPESGQSAPTAPPPSARSIVFPSSLERPDSDLAAGPSPDDLPGSPPMYQPIVASTGATPLIGVHAPFPPQSPPVDSQQSSGPTSPAGQMPVPAPPTQVAGGPAAQTFEPSTELDGSGSAGVNSLPRAGAKEHPGPAASDPIAGLVPSSATSPAITDPVGNAVSSARAHAIGQRIEAIARHLEAQPPPRSVTIRVDDGQPLLITVSVRTEGVHLGVAGAKVADLPWLHTVARQLTDSGFSFAGFSDQHHDDAQQPDPYEPPDRRPRSRQSRRGGLRL